MKKHYEYLLFDADDTLFDYNKSENEALRKTFEDAGLSYKSLYMEVYRGINSQIWKDCEEGKISIEELKSERFRRTFAKLGIENDPQSFGYNYLVNLSNTNYLLEGAVEVVEKISNYAG